MLTKTKPATEKINNISNIQIITKTIKCYNIIQQKHLNYKNNEKMLKKILYKDSNNLTFSKLYKYYYLLSFLIKSCKNKSVILIRASKFKENICLFIDNVTHQGK